jgi:dipeptidyl-peptidase-4
LSPAAQPGTHAYDISPDARWAFHTYQTFESAPVVELVQLPSHKVVRVLEGNASLQASIKTVRKSHVRFFRIDIGNGVLLDSWEIRPPDFDPSKKYPVLFHVYGEPAGQTVLDSWMADKTPWHWMLSEKGYVIVSVDNRGTPGPRGRAWRKSIHHQIGILASLDQGAAARVVRTWPYVDSTRIAVWGWSGGGSMSLNLIFRYPGIYQSAMSIAPVTNQRYYNTIYQERFMGKPDENPDGFKNGSPITWVDGLRGNLLLIHGTGDDNVHYQSTEALVNALIACVLFGYDIIVNTLFRAIIALTRASVLW